MRCELDLWQFEVIISEGLRLESLTSVRVAGHNAMFQQTGLSVDLTILTATDGSQLGLLRGDAAVHWSRN